MPEFAIQDAVLSRRGLLRLAGVAGAGVAGLAVAGCGASGSGGGAGGAKLTMFVWAAGQDRVPREVVAELAKTRSDLSVEFIVGTNAETYPKLVASTQIDPSRPLLNLGFFNPDAFAKGAKAGLWERVDETTVPNVAKVLPAYRTANGLGAYMVMDAMGILYNTKAFPKPPTSWRDLLDPKYRGKVAVWDAPSFALNGLTLLSKLSGGSEADMDPGLRLFAEAARAKHFRALYKSLDEQRKMLASGDIVLTLGFQGTARPWIDAGDPIGFAAPKEGVLAFPEGFQLVKGSGPEQLAAARAVMNAMFDPAAVARYAAGTGTIPLVQGAALDPKYASIPTYQLSTVESAIQLDWGALADATTKYTDAWNREVKAHL
ncbi:ABC transporter substrate-binding protein [Streptosporangium violaceochromogenes]|nr:ABC transporter substrate-binding protein [Streptosporangium violaceochromogenes]